MAELNSNLDRTVSHNSALHPASRMPEKSWGVASTWRAKTCACAMLFNVTTPHCLRPRFMRSWLDSRSSALDRRSRYCVTVFGILLPYSLRNQINLRRAVNLLANGVGGPLHHAEVHARQIFADDAEREELRPGKDRDHPGENVEAPQCRALGQRANCHINQQDEPQDGESESDQAGNLQGQHAEAGRHVERMQHELAQVVV